MTASCPERHSDLHWRLAFGAVILAVFSEFLWKNRIAGEPWQVVLVFVLGAIYALSGMINEADLGITTPRGSAWLVVFQCLLGMTMVLVTPLKGFSGLITMPAASAAVMTLRWPWASLLVATLFGACVLGVGLAFGAGSALQSASSYGVAFAFTVVFSVVTRRAYESRTHAERLSRDLAAANEQLRVQAEQAGELATTRERNRLAREIHDGLGHYLTTINVQLEAARAVLATDLPRATEALGTATRLSRAALDDVRHSVGALRTDAMPLSLPDALRSLASNLELSVDLEVRGTPRLLAPAVEHALYRTAQEGLTNVLKHADAKQTRLTLDYTDAARVILSIANDGALGAATNSSGFGLRGIRERIDLVGGKMNSGPGEPHGFVLRVDVPA